jgi:crotonobetainyl-CoA:carnitine CoA-transferase CaiB-like acyl-CoA transferase
MEALQAAGIEGAVVKDTKEMYEDPQLKKYLWAEMEHPEIGKYHLQLPSFRMSEMPHQLRMTSPLLGQHNEHVYRNFAGLSQEEYEKLDQQGVFD